jgi:hypothetical protein
LLCTTLFLGQVRLSCSMVLMDTFLKNQLNPLYWIPVSLTGIQLDKLDKLE